MIKPGLSAAPQPPAAEDHPMIKPVSRLRAPQPPGSLAVGSLIHWQAPSPRRGALRQAHPVRRQPESR